VAKMENWTLEEIKKEVRKHRKTLEFVAISPETRKAIYLPMPVPKNNTAPAVTNIEGVPLRISRLCYRTDLILLAFENPKNDVFVQKRKTFPNPSERALSIRDIYKYFLMLKEKEDSEI